jgi:hypothetical protein
LSMAVSPRCRWPWRMSTAAWRWFLACAGMRPSIVPPSLSPQASAAANSRKRGANGACRLGRAAPTPPGKTSKWPGTAANASSCGSFRTPLCGTPPGLPQVAIRYVLVADPEGKLRMDAFLCTDLEATPAQILEWAVRRWSSEVTFEEARAHLGLETQCQWSDRAIARTTPVLLALFASVTALALRLSDAGQIPVPMTAWSHKAKPTFVDCLALVRQPLWRARFFVHSAAEPEFVPCPREACERWRTGLS